MIVDLAACQKAVHQYVVEPFDHTFLNKDAPYFAAVVPTAENVRFTSGSCWQPIRELGAQLSPD